MFSFDTAPQFRAAGPAAKALIDYLGAHADLKAGQWDFEQGMVSRNGRSRAWAEFSRDAEANVFVRDRVSIIAMETVSGDWNVGHTVTRAER